MCSLFSRVLRSLKVCNSNNKVGKIASAVLAVALGKWWLQREFLRFFPRAGPSYHHFQAIYVCSTYSEWWDLLIPTQIHHQDCVEWRKKLFLDSNCPLWSLLSLHPIGKPHELHCVRSLPQLSSLMWSLLCCSSLKTDEASPNLHHIYIYVGFYFGGVTHIVWIMKNSVSKCFWLGFLKSLINSKWPNKTTSCMALLSYCKKLSFLSDVLCQN